MKRIMIILLATLVGSPVFACGPTPGGQNGSGSGGQGKRHKQHRQGEHFANEDHERNRRFLHEDNRGELLLESIDGGHGTFSKWSPAETRRRMENRAGYLLQKYKQGTLTNNQANELMSLMHALAQP